MKKIIQLLLTLFVSVAFFSCKEQYKTQEEQMPKVQVKISHISEGYLPDFIELSAKTIYFKRNTVVAPISGYVTKVNVQQGESVTKDKVLFEIQSTEAHAMKQNNNSNSNYGLVKIHAPINGIITDLNVTHEEVYIEQGSAMSVLIASNNLKVQTYVPYEFREYVQIGTKCEIVLPDNTRIQSLFSKIMPQMNEQSQTIEVLANLDTRVFIPENMIVKVLVDKGVNQKSQIISKNCLQTDALMTNFWVMKLINDSIAIKTPVTVGKQEHTQVEILSPKFNKSGRIISQGAYGLNDTVFVEIIK